MTNSLYITVPFPEFSKKYILAKRTKCKEAVTYCLEALSECFQSWDKDFFDLDFENNINLKTLMSLLAADDKPKASLDWKIKSYKNYLSRNELTLIDHLNESLLIHMMKETVTFDAYNKHYRLLYFIAREIKYSLFKIIRRICQKTKSDFFTNPQSQKLTKTYLDNFINIELHFLLQENKLLFSIIYSFVTENSNWKTIKTKYQLNNEELKVVKGELLQWIRKVL